MTTDKCTNPGLNDCVACGGSEAQLLVTLRACNSACVDKLERHAEPIPMLLVCPVCGKRHIDTGTFATKPHHTHACQFCGTTWRPAIVSTVGMQFLPGFKNEEEPANVYG